MIVSVTLLFVFCFICTSLCQLRPLREILLQRGGECDTVPPRTVPVLSSFAHTRSYHLRMVLEVYFDQPLAGRSFFHGCSQNESLLVHDSAPSNLPNSMYTKRNAYEVVASKCRYSRSPSVCCRQQAALYADHAIQARLNANGHFTVIDVDKILSQNMNYTSSMIPLVAKRHFTKTNHTVDQERIRTIFVKLTPGLVFNRMKDAGVKVYINSQSLRSFISIHQSDISIAFSSVLREHDLSSENRSAVQRDFPEIDFQEVNLNSAETTPTLAHFRAKVPTLVRQRKPSANLQLPLVPVEQTTIPHRVTPAPTTLSISSIPPNVHVLIPSRHPKPEQITRCVRSLATKANLNFGKVSFHFGIDWKDSVTDQALQVTCAAFQVECTTHPVFDRAGDVSTIVNHMFAHVDERGYFLRFNDDSEMLTQGWNEIAIKALRKPPMDVGLAFIQDHHAKKIGKSRLQTHSFVSSVHKDIFGYYFVHHFRNWYEDDWITEIYDGRFTKQTPLQLKHHTEGVRYEAQKTFDKEALEYTLQHARARIQKYVVKHAL
eukprot:TRINITY_DN7527_c0_g1_i1.p1 TRINITY_DN7527_c0_g1~~TRINITY_DN7527_c0_g1_i1.p1  ORF type:complete len:545 (-),score=-22.44 TRINITY_DN7527_c0_g1_i1:26-1660(-)